MKKRILSTFLTLALLLTLLPTAVMAEGENKNTIYTRYVSSNSSAGSGTQADPFNFFEDALNKAEAGDTIVILGKAYQNDTAGGTSGIGAPLIINTPVTIEGRTEQNGVSNASFEIRSGGIVLGADVTMKNVVLELTNRYHNAIFANGHRLTAENVTRGNSARQVHLFAGGIGRVDHLASVNLPAPGDSAVLNLQNSTFGNIYAGGVAAGYTGAVSVTVKNGTVGTIYGSGANESVPGGDWFDLTEPPAPTANPNYTVSGPVNITVDGASTVGEAYTVSVNGNGSSDTSLTINTAVESKKLNLADLKNLTINGGTAAVAAINETADVTLNNNATVSFAGTNSKTINSLSGNGKIVLGKEDKLTITGAFNGTHDFETTGGTDGQSGLAATGHTYITAASGNATVNFTPYESQKDFLTLNKNTENGGFAWVTSNAPESKKYVEKLEIGPASKNITKTVKEINDEINDGAEIKVLIGSNDSLQDVPLTFTVNEQKAA